MRKYITLSFFGLFGGGLLLYIFIRGEDHILKTQQDMSYLFLHAKEVEASIEKDLLKSRNFLLPNYDSLVENENEALLICRKLKSHKTDKNYKTLGQEVGLAVDEYCFALEQKLRQIELFKSKNAILRNSLYFIHTLDLSETKKNHLLGGREAIRKNLIRSSLSYAMISTEEAKIHLSNLISQAENISHPMNSYGDLEVVISHSQKILYVKHDLDFLVNQITGPDTEGLLEKLRSVYFQSFLKSEKVSEMYRKIIFIVAVCLFLFTIFSISRLWRAAQSLTEANTLLEQRVEERTCELKRSHETIVQQQQSLITSSKMSALGEMAGGVAHEINTPIASIKILTEQMIEMFNEKEFDTNFFKNTTKSILETINKIAKIISGMRSFCRDGSSDPFSEVKIMDVISEALNLCLEKFTQGNVQVTVNSSNPELSLETRPTELAQVLLNLLSNAYDAAVKNKEAWISITVLELKSDIELRVTDSGLGIPAHIRSKIFQPFFTTKDIGKGTGLGLSSSLGIVNSHNGSLFVDEDCSNTCFVIRLPKKQPEIKNVAA